MPTYKLIGARPDETPEETIIRCANNLIKAVIAAGYSLHSTSGLSGVDVHIYNHVPHKIDVTNAISGWRVTGNTPLKITFAPSPTEVQRMNDTTEEE